MTNNLAKVESQPEISLFFIEYPSALGVIKLLVVTTEKNEIFLLMNMNKKLFLNVIGLATEKVENGELLVKPAYYDVKTGKVSLLQ